MMNQITNSLEIGFGSMASSHLPRGLVLETSESPKTMPTGAERPLNINSSDLMRGKPVLEISG
jgi:hypothetical protein